VLSLKEKTHKKHIVFPIDTLHAIFDDFRI